VFDICRSRAGRDVSSLLFVGIMCPSRKIVESCVRRDFDVVCTEGVSRMREVGCVRWIGIYL